MIVIRIDLSQSFSNIGVTIRGGRGLDELGLHLYSLSDVEEDEDYPGKQYETLSSIYTYTNSTVMHPDDGMSLTSSLPQSQMSSKINSISSSRHPRYLIYHYLLCCPYHDTFLVTIKMH